MGYGGMAYVLFDFLCIRFLIDILLGNAILKRYVLETNWTLFRLLRIFSSSHFIRIGRMATGCCDEWMLLLCKND